MKLEIRPRSYIVPSYSLVGDLLASLRCKLQYRYYNRSELPPSRPIQYWFGQMLHGTLEMAYRHWKSLKDDGQQIPEFPWPCNEWNFRETQQGLSQPSWVDHDIGKFAYEVEASLTAQGITARSMAVRAAAFRRVEVAVNEIGKHLFPLITAAERRVIATRSVPETTLPIRTDKYEIHGIIDVLTSMNLSQAAGDNPIRQKIKEVCPSLAGDFEVIVDYKGSRRPQKNEPYWAEGGWQIQTYAWLRQKQPESLQVAAGILLYLNELLPGNAEMRHLQQALEAGTTDVLPVPGSRDEQLIRMWQPGTNPSQISLGFRLARALRIIPVSEASITDSLQAFDQAVLSIETDIMNETNGKNIQDAWQANCEDADTCSACDFRWSCPSPKMHRGKLNYKPKAPPAISE